MSRPHSIPSKVMDFSNKIRAVISEFDCNRHNAPEGQPCFSIRMDSREGHYAAICNDRAKKRFNGVPNKLFKKEKR